MAESRKARKSPTATANNEFSPAQMQFFAKMKEFDDRLRLFIGKSLVEGTDEYNQCQAVWQERSHFINEWRAKHTQSERIDTPARLLELIEQRQVTLGMIPLAYGGGFPAGAAREYYGEAFRLALDIAKSNPALPTSPERVSDPQVGLDNLRRWCIMAVPTDLISTSVVLKDYKEVPPQSGSPDDGQPFYKPMYFKQWNIGDDLLRRNKTDEEKYIEGKVRRKKQPGNGEGKRPVYWYSEPDARKRWPDRFAAIENKPAKS